MEVINKSDCLSIIEVVYPDQSITIAGYRFEEFQDHVEGFLSTTKKLVIEFTTEENRSQQQMCFFAKTLPRDNQFHEEYVRSTNGFAKEVFFYNKIKPNLDIWSMTEVMPKCYLAVHDKIVVLEIMSNYHVKDIANYFSEEEIKSAIKSVAVLHSASMMCESRNGINPQSVWGDYFFDALYLRKDNHLGFRHTTVGIKAIKSLIDNKCKEMDEKCKKRIYFLYDTLPESILPSKKFRNVVSHGDLYTNNIMQLKSPTDGIVSKIVDFQLFRFNPPALDLLMLIHLTTDLSSRAVDLNSLTDYYYDCLSNNMNEFGFNVSVELPREEFTESLKAMRSLSLAIALLFQHYVNLPPTLLKIIMEDPVNLKTFLLEDRNETVLTSFQSDAAYRNKLLTTISMLCESCKNDINQ